MAAPLLHSSSMFLYRSPTPYAQRTMSETHEMHTVSDAQDRADDPLPPSRGDYDVTALRARARSDAERIAVNLTFVNGRPTRSPYIMPDEARNVTPFEIGRRDYADSFNRRMSVTVGRSMRQHLESQPGSAGLNRPTARCFAARPSVPDDHNGAISSDIEKYCRYIDHVLEREPDHKWIKVLKDWQCPLSLFAMRDPAVADDGRFYELKQIEEYNLRGVAGPGGLRSPLTNDPMSNNVTLCPTVKAQMQAWVEADVADLPGDTVVTKLETVLGIAPGTDLSAEGTRGMQPAPFPPAPAFAPGPASPQSSFVDAEAMESYQDVVQRRVRAASLSRVQAARETPPAQFRRPSRGEVAVARANELAFAAEVDRAQEEVDRAQEEANRDVDAQREQRTRLVDMLTQARAGVPISPDSLAALVSSHYNFEERVRAAALASARFNGIVDVAPPPPDAAPAEPDEEPDQRFLRDVATALMARDDWRQVREDDEARDLVIREAVEDVRANVLRNGINSVGLVDAINSVQDNVLLFYEHANFNMNHYTLLNDAMGYQVVPPPVSRQRAVDALSSAVGEPSDAEDSGSDDDSMPGLVDDDSEQDENEMQTVD